MKRQAFFTILSIAVLLISGCRKDEPVDDDFLAGNDIELKVGASVIHRYDPLTWQLSFNKDRLVYRVFQRKSPPPHYNQLPDMHLFLIQ